MHQLTGYTLEPANIPDVFNVVEYGSYVNAVTNGKNIMQYTIDTPEGYPAIDNYTVTTVWGSINVSRKKIAKPAEPSVKTFDYCKSEVNYNIVENDGYNIHYSDKTNAGNQTATISLKPNYQWSDSTTTALTYKYAINKFKLVVKIDDLTMDWGDNLPQITYSMYVNDILQPSLRYLSPSPIYKNSKGDILVYPYDVGEYSISITETSFIYENGEEKVCCRCNGSGKIYLNDTDITKMSIRIAYKSIKYQHVSKCVVVFIT